MHNLSAPHNQDSHNQRGIMLTRCLILENMTKEMRNVYNMAITKEKPNIIQIHNSVMWAWHSD
jgi:hypothetical protein